MADDLHRLLRQRAAGDRDVRVDDRARRRRDRREAPTARAHREQAAARGEERRAADTAHDHSVNACAVRNPERAQRRSVHANACADAHVCTRVHRADRTARRCDRDVASPFADDNAPERAGEGSARKDNRGNHGRGEEQLLHQGLLSLGPLQERQTPEILRSRLRPGWVPLRAPAAGARTAPPGPGAD